jgi:hypothetical protein
MIMMILSEEEGDDAYLRPAFLFPAGIYSFMIMFFDPSAQLLYYYFSVMGWG